MPGLGAIWVPLITFGVITAATEELWYRGPLYAEYRRHGVSVFKTALISGVLFGIIHAGLFQIAYTAFFGILWVYMFYYTRSFLAPLLSHIIVNSLGFLLDPMFLLNDYNIFWDIKQTYVLIIGVFALMMTPIAVLCMKRLITDNPVEETDKVSESMQFTFIYWALIIIMVVFAVIFMI